MRASDERNIFDELALADNIILKELASASNDHKNILDIFAKGVALYKKYVEKHMIPFLRQ